MAPAWPLASADFSFSSSGGAVSVSVLDIGLGLIVLLFLVRGLLRGMINEVAGFIGFFLALFLAGRFYPQLAPQFAAVVPSQSWSLGLSYAVIFTATLVLVALCAAVARKFLALALPPWLDSLIGALVGTCKGLLICALGIAIMQHFVPDSPFLKGSVLAEHMAGVAAFARTLLPAFISASRSLSSLIG